MFTPSDELRALQLKCLEILDAIHELCVHNGIEYSLCGGSVIGAYLYKGVIPWDDDIDLMMDRQNYDKFIKVCKFQLKYPYKLVHYSATKEAKIGFAKVVDESTTLVESGTYDDYNISGVFVDITVYDCIPSNKINKKQKTATLVRTIHSGKNPINLKRKIINVISRITPHFIKKILLSMAERSFKKYDKTEDCRFVELFGFAPNDCHYPANIFDRYSNILFEGKEYRIISDYLIYLKIRYKRDNYYIPEDQQIPHHVLYCDLKTPYRELDKNKLCIPKEDLK